MAYADDCNKTTELVLLVGTLPSVIFYFLVSKYRGVRFLPLTVLRMCPLLWWISFSIWRRSGFLTATIPSPGFCAVPPWCCGAWRCFTSSAAATAERSIYWDSAWWINAEAPSIQDLPIWETTLKEKRRTVYRSRDLK